MINLDLTVSTYLFALGRAWPDWVILALAVVLIWFLFAFVLYQASRLGSRREKVLFLARAAAAALIGLVLNSVIAYFYFRTRPFAALGFEPLIVKSALEKSFPSDHAVVAGALAATLFFYNKKSGYWGIAAAALIVLGRVLSGVHYVSDVLAGAGIGLLIGLLVFKISGNVGAPFRDGRR